MESEELLMKMLIPVRRKFSQKIIAQSKVFASKAKQQKSNGQEEKFPKSESDRQ